LHSDFLGGAGEFSLSPASGGTVTFSASSSIPGYLRPVGFCSLIKGITNAAARAAISGSLNIFTFGQYVCDFESRFILTSASVPGTDEFDTYAGFIDSLTGTIADGAFLRIIGGQNLQFVVANNNNTVGSVITTPITVNSIVGQLLRLKINVSEGASPVATFELYQSNPGPNSTEFLLTSGQISTNIPIAVNRQTGSGVALVGRIGTINHSLEVDYITVEADFK
jgi:hypothetical protein